MAASWDATGKLKPLWRTVGGRDELARLAGITPAGTLSAYNSGSRPLGYKNGRKLAEALGVTIFDLGAPAAQAQTPEEATVLDRLQELEDGLTEALEGNTKLTRQVSALQARVARLETQRGLGGDGAAEEPL